MFIWRGMRSQQHLGPCIASGSNTWCHCDSEVSDSGYDIVGGDGIGITCITRNECDDDEYVWIWVNDAPWPNIDFPYDALRVFLFLPPDRIRVNATAASMVDDVMFCFK